MNKIHRKSAISQTSDLILAAHKQGEDLLWGRYERQLPLCAFTDNGLSCRKCFHGPCRINPFGDEPSLGVCGADRDQIVMENLFQATLAGVLETARFGSLLNGRGSVQEFPPLESDLPSKAQKKLSAAGIVPVRKEQLLEVQNSYFSHKGYLSKTLMDLTRLGLIHYRWLKEISALLDKLPYGPPLFAAEGANILLVGYPPLDLLPSLHQQAGQLGRGKKINILVQGEAGLSYLPAIADYGTLELALAMNLDALITTPQASWPALEVLAPKFGIPVILLEGAKPVDEIASQAINLALRHRLRGSYITASRFGPPDSYQGKQKSVLANPGRVKEAYQAGRIQGVVVILGEANVKQTFFERTLILMENCLNKRFLVLAGGQLAAQAAPLNEELKKRLAGRLSSLAVEEEIEGLSSLNYFGSFYEIPKVVAFLKNLTQEEGLARIPVAVAFPEFFRAGVWATAVTFLSMGFAVQIGIPLPFWGSPALTEILLKEWPKISGGTFLAAPSLPSPQEQAQELIAFIEAQKEKRRNEASDP